MAESLRNNERSQSFREHPLWKRKERVAEFHSGLAVFFLSAALAVPAVSDLAEKFHEPEEDGKPAAAETVKPVAVSVKHPKIFSEKTAEKNPVRNLPIALSVVTAGILGIVGFKLCSLYSGFSAWRRDQRKRQGFTNKQMMTDCFELLPEEHPLRAKVEEYGRMTGINVSRVYLDPVPQYRNAGASRDGKGGAVIFFRGNPLSLPDGKKILKGVTAHELAHIKRNSAAGTYLLRAVGALHGIVAAGSAGMVMGGIREGLFSVLLKGSLAVLAALPALSRWQSRNEEALTDLEGAEMVGDPQALIVNKKYLQSHKPGGDDWSPTEIDSMNLRSFVMGVFGSTHPGEDMRISNLRTVFGIHNEKPRQQRNKVPSLDL